MKLLKLKQYSTSISTLSHLHEYVLHVGHLDLSKLMKTNRTCFWHFLETSSIQMEWLHSESEGNLQISEDTIYEFVPLQKTSLLSAQKGVSVQVAVMKDTERNHIHKLLWPPKVKNVTEKPTTKRYRNHTEMSDPPLAISMPK